MSDKDHNEFSESPELLDDGESKVFQATGNEHQSRLTTTGFTVNGKEYKLTKREDGFIAEEV